MRYFLAFSDSTSDNLWSKAVDNVNRVRLISSFSLVSSWTLFFDLGVGRLVVNERD